MDNQNANAPCKNCEDRCVGCHSSCQRYITFKHEIDEKNKEIREKKEKIWRQTDTKINGIKRIRNKRNRKSK